MNEKKKKCFFCGAEIPEGDLFWTHKVKHIDKLLRSTIRTEFICTNPLCMGEETFWVHMRNGATSFWGP